MRTIKDLKAGDSIYILKSGLMFRGNVDLEEVIITKINSSSLYFKFKDTGHERRISLRTMEGELTSTFKYKAYINKEDYYGPLELEKNKREVKSQIIDVIKDTNISLEELVKLKAIIDEKIN